MKKYSTLIEIQNDINNDEFDGASLSLLHMHNILYDIPLPDRLYAFKDIHNYMINTYQLAINKIDEYSDENKEQSERIITHFEDTINRITNRLTLIDNLIELYNDNDNNYPLIKNKAYEIIKNINTCCHFSDTGEGIGSYEINSKKVKILDISVFNNKYHEFIFDLKDTLFHSENNEISFILVSPSYGQFKNIPIYMPINQIKQ